MKKKIFSDFSLYINKGDKILLNAPSGSGKSTLIKMLLGFQKPDSGAVLVNENVLDKNTCHHIRSQCSYVSQDVDLPKLPVKELFSRIYNFKVNNSLEFSDSKIHDTFMLFDLDQSILNKNVKDLSGGERQRLGLVICVLMDRSIWLLDEVTSGLDKELKKKVFNLVVNSNKTVIIISHDEIWNTDHVKKVRWE